MPLSKPSQKKHTIFHAYVLVGGKEKIPASYSNMKMVGTLQTSICPQLLSHHRDITFNIKKQSTLFLLNKQTVPNETG